MAGAAAAPRSRRVGTETRQRVQQVALRLFISQGYEATSLRQIGDELGINKASLYYYFPSKEAILRSLFQQRGTEAQELLDWLEQQPASPGLIEEAVLRWVDSYSVEKLQGIRFLRANPHITRVLGESGATRIADPLTAFAERLAALMPDPTPERIITMRMATLSINAAVEATIGTDVPDEATVTAARITARALLRTLSA